MADLRGLTLKHLRAHEATVRHGSVTAAARELLVTPPAITSQLKSLEAMVGAALYDRTRDGFVPTEIGRALLEAAIDIEKLVARTGARLRALQSGAAGSIIFGVVSTAKYIAPRLVARFQAANPDISVKLVIGNRSEILRGLDHNEYDVLLMGRPPEHVPLEAKLLCDHPHVIIAAPDHPLAVCKSIEESRLAHERFLSREHGSGTRLLMERLLARVSPRQPIDVIEMGTNETIKQAVMAGLGIAFISAHTCMTELAEGKLVALRVNGLPIVRQWYIVHRSDRDVPMATRVFEAFVADNSAELIPRLV